MAKTEKRMKPNSVYHTVAKLAVEAARGDEQSELYSCMNCSSGSFPAITHAKQPVRKYFFVLLLLFFSFFNFIYILKDFRPELNTFYFPVLAKPFVNTENDEEQSMA